MSSRNVPTALKVAAALLGFSAFTPGIAQAQSPAPQCSSVAKAPLVRLQLGKSTVIRPSVPVSRILLGNPDGSRAGRPAEAEVKAAPVGAGAGTANAAAPATSSPPAAGGGRPGVAEVDVLLLSSSEIYLLGKGLGTTNVVMLDRKGGCTAFDVVVDMDTVALDSVIRQLLPEERDIKITPAFDTIVLSGTVSDPEALTRVLDLATAFARGGGKVINMLGVGAPQQVLLDVKVAEVSKGLMEKMGINVASMATGGGWSANLMANFLTGGGASAALARNNVSIGIDAQKDDGQVRVLAEPSIMAVSGQTGSFLAGGKVFIPVSSTNNNGGREITLEEKEFGVSVKFTPTVMGGGRINLRVRPEVSEISKDGITLASGGGSAILPSFTSRKAETTVQLMDGQSFAIGGLIKNNTTTNIKALPVLGELPVIGALFRSSQFQNDRTELVFVVTPHLVKPLPAQYKLPTDYEASPSPARVLIGGQVSQPVIPEDRAAPAPVVSPNQNAGGGFDAPATEAQP
jgi:pilus assembly protein CpaC